MKDKFRTNIKVALPAAICTLIILIIISLKGAPAEIGSFDFNIWQALPYFIVLGAAIAGINVFAVLCIGTVLFLFVGLFTGSLTLETAFSSMGSGTSGMFETMVVAILVAAIGALIYRAISPC